MPTYTNTAKYLFRRLVGSNLISDVDAGIAALADDVDAKIVGQSSGPLASLPTSTTGTPGIVGREYYATDTGQWFKDYGTGWRELGTLPGEIRATARSTIPTGWLVCDGAAVSRTTYAALFTAISTVYGAGDGTTTFNLPDLRGRAPVGVDNVGVHLTNFHFLGQSGGEDLHTLTTAEMPSHSHALSGVSFYGPNIGGAGAITAGAAGQQFAANTQTIGNTGGGGAHQNMPPFQIVNWMVKT